MTWANDAFDARTGYALEELVGKVPGQLHQWEKPSSDVLRDIREGLRDRRGFNVTLLNHAKDGRPHWVEIPCNPLADDATEEPIGFIAIESDVTDRFAIQEALQHSHERLQLATEVAEMGIWSLAPKTGQMAWNGNDQNCHLHGMKPGQDCSTANICFEFQLNHPDRGPRILSSIARAVQDRGRILSCNRPGTGNPDGGNVGPNAQERARSEFWVEFPCLPEEPQPKAGMKFRRPEVDHA